MYKQLYVLLIACCINLSAQEHNPTSEIQKLNGDMQDIYYNMLACRMGNDDQTCLAVAEKVEKVLQYAARKPLVNQAGLVSKGQPGNWFSVEKIFVEKGFLSLTTNYIRSTLSMTHAQLPGYEKLFFFLNLKSINFDGSDHYMNCSYADYQTNCLIVNKKQQRTDFYNAPSKSDI